MHLYFLSLGSNLDPEQNLVAAVRFLAAWAMVRRVSRAYETAPYGTRQPQPNYLNAAVLVESDLEPEGFQRLVIDRIEEALGRVRMPDKFAPRTIDIDIMLVDDLVMAAGGRQIPSPESASRDFVAIPLAELAPDHLHPLEGETLSAIAARFVPDPDHFRPRPDVDLGIPGAVEG